MKSPKHVMRNAQTLVVEALVRNPAGQKAFKCAAKRPPPFLACKEGWYIQTVSTPQRGNT